MVNVNRFINFIMILIFLFISVFFHYFSNKNDYSIDLFFERLRLNNTLHYYYSYISLMSQDLSNDFLKNGFSESDRIDNSVKCIIRPEFSERYKAFFSEGKYFSNESRGYISLKAVHGAFSKEVLFNYDFLRINSPFSSRYAFYVRNIQSPASVNSILNNSNGNPINGIYPINVYADSGFVFLDGKREITLNVANGDGKYGENHSLPEKIQSSTHVYDFSGSCVELKRNPAFEEFDFSSNQHYSSVLRFYHGKFSNNIRKAYFRLSYNRDFDNSLSLLKYKSEIPENLPEDYFSEYQKTMSDRISEIYSADIIPDFVSEQNDFERFDFLTYSDLQDNSFFLNRITERVSDLSLFHDRENNSLSPDNNVIFIDRPYLYIPYTDIVRSNGVIICSGDIYIDTLKNPMKRFLTIVSTNGKIIIGNEVEACLIALSPNGKLQGSTNSRKTVRGNVIVDSIDFDSLRKGADIFYENQYQTPVYNLTVSKESIYISHTL